MFEHFKGNVSSSSVGDHKPWFILLLLPYYVQILFYVCYDKGYDWMCGEVIGDVKGLKYCMEFWGGPDTKIYSI